MDFGDRCEEFETSDGGVSLGKITLNLSSYNRYFLLHKSGYLLYMEELVKTVRK